MWVSRVATLGRRPSILSPLRLLASGSAETTAATSSSFTPTARSRIIAIAGSRRLTTAPSTATYADSLTALTWTSLVSGVNTAADPRWRLRIQWADTPASPAAMTITATSLNANLVMIHVFEILGSAVPTNNGTVNNTTGDGAASLTTLPAPTSTIMLCGAFEGTDPVNAPAGFVELDELVASTARQQVCVRVGSAGLTATYSSTNANTIAGVIEIPSA